MEYQITEVINAMNLGVINEQEGRSLINELIDFALRLGKLRDNLNTVRRETSFENIGKLSDMPIR